MYLKHILTSVLPSVLLFNFISQAVHQWDKFPSGLSFWIVVTSSMLMFFVVDVDLIFLLLIFDVDLLMF